MQFPKPIKKSGKKHKIISKYKAYKNLLDDIFSLFIRIRDDWTCIHCGRKLTDEELLTGVKGEMNNSHYENRDNFALRWNEQNCDCACQACHRHQLEQKKHAWYRDFKIKQLGQSGYDRLMIMAEANKREAGKICAGDLMMMCKFYLDVISRCICEKRGRIDEKHFEKLFIRFEKLKDGAK